MKNAIQSIRRLAKEIESLLVSKDYARIAEHSRLTEEAIKKVLLDCGGIVTKAPETAYEKMSPVRVKNFHPPKWAVDFDLWIDNKQSDLTLELTVKSDKDGNLSAILDNLHVL